MPTAIDAKFYFRKRYLIAFILFFGRALDAIVKGSLGVVLTDITNYKYVVAENKTTILQKPEVDWNSRQVGFTLGAATYGQVPTQFISGALARKYGGTTILLSGILLLSIPTVITPALMYSYFPLFIVARLIEGAGAGLVNGSIAEIILNWAIIEEQARYLLSIHVGYNIGIICSNIVSGYMIHFLNWKAVFFVAGGTGLLFFTLGLLLISNRPDDDRFITDIEKRYLKVKINIPKDANMSIFSYPWKEILTSKPVWAFFNDAFCCGWSSAFIVLCLPLYIKDATKSETKNVALMSAIPFLCALITEFVVSYILDYIRSRKHLDKSKAYRLFISFGHSGVASCLIMIALWANFESSLILISIAQSLIVMKLLCYNVLSIDAFYRLAAVVMSSAGGFYMLAHCLSPLLMGFIVKNHERSEWNLYFGLLVFFNIWSIIIYFYIGSSELQPWATTRAKSNDYTRNKKVAKSIKETSA